MPIEAPSGTLDIENAKLRVSEFSATTSVGIGTENTQTHPLYIYKASEPEIVLQEGTTAAAKLTSNDGSLIIQSGVTLSDSSTGDIVFSDMGVANRRMTIKGSSGNVGIGTTNPTEIFHVHENISTTGHQIISRVGGSTSSYNTLVFGSKEGRPHIGGHRGDYGLWADLSLQNDLMVLKQSNMSVGIGTTNPVGDLHITAGTTTGSITEIYLGDTNAPDATSIMRYYKGDNGSNPGRLTFGNWGDDFATGTTTMCIKKGGNVGIGSSSPEYKLDVLGISRLSSRLNVHQGSEAPVFSNVMATSSDGGRAQLVVSSAYSDIMIASSRVNNVHGSTLSFMTYNPSDTLDHRAFVINQGNWGSRKHMLDFGYEDAGYSNPHYNINYYRDATMTLDGLNRRVGIGSTNPTTALDVVGTTTVSGEVHIATTSTNGGPLTIRAKKGMYSAASLSSLRSNASVTIHATGADADALCIGMLGTDTAGNSGDNPYAYIQNMWDNQLSARPLLLNPAGGTVCIGSATPTTTTEGRLEIKNGDNSIVYLGPNSTWNSYLILGAGPDQTVANDGSRCQVISTNGNLHLDAGHSRDIFLNYYRGNSVLFGSTATAVHSSDDRLKTQEELIENATDTLMKLKPQKYLKKLRLSEEETRPPVVEAGLIAQDVWYDAPELRFLVKLGSDANPSTEKPPEPVPGDIQQDPDYSSWGTEESSLSYIGLIPYLIKSNQELHAQLTSVLARLDALENA